MMLFVMTRKWLGSMNFANKNIVIITGWYANYHYSHTQLFKFSKYCVLPEKRFKYLILLSSCFHYTLPGIICVSTICVDVLRFQLTWESMWYPYFYEHLQQSKYLKLLHENLYLRINWENSKWYINIFYYS